MTYRTGASHFDFPAVFGLLWGGRWTVALVALVCTFIGVYYATIAAVPVFRATATVILNSREERVIDFENVMGGLSGDASVVASEVEVLRARSLMARVVDRLDLTSDPEFNPALRAPTTLDQLRALVKTDAKMAPDYDLARDIAVDILLQKTTIRNVPKSLVFEIVAQSKDPKKSARIADTISEIYVLNQIEVKFDATEQATLWLTTRVSELQGELELAEAKVKAFSTDIDLVSVDALQGIERQMKDLRDRIVGAEIAAAEAQKRLQDLQRAKDPQTQVDIAADPQLTRFALRIASTDDKSMLEAFGLRYDQIVARAELQAARATSQLEALRVSQGELETRIASQTEDLITLQQLTREAEASRLLYEYFLSRLKETSAQQGIQQADSRILSPAVIPRAAAAPRQVMIMGMAAIFGLMLGATIVLLREIGQNTFRTARDLETVTGLTVLGQVPVIPAKNRAATLEYLIEKPTSAAAEAVRNLRTSVLLSNVDQPPQVIVSTSSVPSEGKTTNSIALALNFVGMGKRVLLIEGDIRRRVFQDYFDGLPNRGLISVLSGQVPFENAVMSDAAMGLDILVGERSTRNAADLYSSDAFRSMIADLRACYDMIVIDTPPVLVVPDARIISQVSDAVLFTVKWDSTRRTQVEDALRMFDSVGQSVTGLILGQIDPRGMRRYGYGESYGAYSSYGDAYYAT